MDSNAKLISGFNTPTQLPLAAKPLTSSNSYTASGGNGLSLLNSSSTASSNISSSMQQLHYQQQQQQQSSVQYTTVQSMENKARSRNPLNGGDMDTANHQLPTHYTTIGALSSNPIDV